MTAEATSWLGLFHDENFSAAATVGAQRGYIGHGRRFLPVEQTQTDMTSMRPGSVGVLAIYPPGV